MAGVARDTSGLADVTAELTGGVKGVIGGDIAGIATGKPGSIAPVLCGRPTLITLDNDGFPLIECELS